MTQIGCDARAQPLLALIGGQGLVPSTNREFDEAFLSDQDRWPSGAGLPKETARGGADDTVDVDDHSDAGAVGVLLTLGLEDGAVDLVVELVGDPSPTFDRQVTRSGTSISKNTSETRGRSRARTNCGAYVLPRTETDGLPSSRTQAKSS